MYNIDPTLGGIREHLAIHRLPVPLPAYPAGAVSCGPHADRGDRSSGIRPRYVARPGRTLVPAQAGLWPVHAQLASALYFSGCCPTEYFGTVDGGTLDPGQPR